MTMKKILMVAAFFAAAIFTSYATDYFVSPTGNDSNSGLEEKKPFATLGKVMPLLKPGDNVYLLPDTFRVQPSEVQMVEKGIYTDVFYFDQKGEKGMPISIVGLTRNGLRPVFDFSAIHPEGRRISGFLVRGQYLVFRNFETAGIQSVLPTHAQSENFRVMNGHHNTFDNIAAHDGMGIGFYLMKHSDHNLVLNCDSYNNFDYVGGSATPGDGGNNDGFGAHLSGTDCNDNIFIGCRAWCNSDDGFDLINCNSPMTIEYCIAYRNGYSQNADGTFKGRADGNGIKSGGFTMVKKDVLRPDPFPVHQVHDNITARNGSNGIYSNHQLGGVHFYNNASYRNGRNNYNFVNRRGPSAQDAVDVNGYGHVVENNLAFAGNRRHGNIGWLNGDTDSCTVKNNSFSWDKANKTWVNEEYTDADFESIDMNVLRAQRNADGTYSKETLQFMLLKNNPNSYGVRAGKYLEAIANAKKISGAE